MNELKTTIQEVIKDMYSRVERIDEGRSHHYVRKDTSKWLAGISSITKLYPKEFLAPWAAKEAVLYLGYGDEKKAEEITQKIVGMNAKEYQDLLEEAKKSYNRKSTDAKLKGTDGHSFMEKWVLARIRNTELPEIPKIYTELFFDDFLKWEKENIKEWILSEALVSDLYLEIAGTLDALVLLNNGKLAVIDFKFANTIDKDYFLQVVGYSIPFERYGIEISERLILRFPKEEKRKIWHEDIRKYEIIDNKFEVIKSPYDYEWEKKVFQNMRELYKYSNVENKIKVVMKK